MKGKPTIVCIRSNRLSADVYLGGRLYVTNRAHATVYKSRAAAERDRVAIFALLSRLDHPSLSVECIDP